MTTGDLVPFIYKPDQEVRFLEQDGMLWIPLLDVCTALGIGNTNSVARRIPDSEQRFERRTTSGGTQTMLMISEAAVYRIIFTSRAPEAEAFKDWVTTVLSDLRKHGVTATPEFRKRVAVALVHAEHYMWELREAIERGDKGKAKALGAWDQVYQTAHLSALKPIAGAEAYKEASEGFRKDRLQLVKSQILPEEEV